MDVRFHSIEKSGLRPDGIILLTFSGGAPSLAERFSGAPLASSPLAWMAQSKVIADHTGKKGELTVCYGSVSDSSPRVVLAGLGDKSGLSFDGFRAAVASAARQCKQLRLARLAVLLEDLDTVAEALGKKQTDVLRETVVACSLATYVCTEYRSVESKAKGIRGNDPDYFEPDSLTVLHSDKVISASLRAAVRLAEAEAAGVRCARELVNAPANIMTPARMAEEAQLLAKRHGFICRILQKPELVKLGMGALLAVNDGSEKDARLIVIEHAPKGAKKRDPLVLVGKGLTFDSGGISLKPAAGMHLMKGDMAGGAAVLGAFEAIGRYSESVSVPVVGIIPCTENMPDGAAVRPGDVVTAFSGKTIEILNTDAEGRLILCDAMAYAQKHWTPLALVDIATLTGACMVALGRNAAGLFTENQALRDTVMDLSGAAGEAVWPMPLWDRLKESLKSDVADIANVGAREGGAITAALFLQSFIENGTPWAHIDMAGAGISESATPLCAKGATGFGVRTLFGLARRVTEKMLK